MKFHFAILSLVLMFLIGGCSTAKLQGVWKDAEYTEKSTSILIVGVAIRKDRRQLFETTLAKNLKEHGVKAIPSYTIFTKEEMEEQSAADYIKEKNIDSVIVVKVLNSKAIEQRAENITVYTSRIVPIDMNSSFRGYSGWRTDYQYWNTTVGNYGPNYVISNLEASLYKRGNKKIVWTALVKIDGIEDDETGVKDLANSLIKQMVKDGLI